MKLLTYKYGYVYKTTNLIDNKIYIGRHHCSHFDPYYKGSGTKLNIAIKEFGSDNFSVEILKWCSTRYELDMTEVYYIELYKATDPNIGYNIGVCPYSIQRYGSDPYKPHNKGKSWYYDPINDKNYQLDKTDPIIEKLGLVKKMKQPKRRFKTVWYHDDKQNYRIKKGDPVPEGLIKGMLYEKINRNFEYYFDPKSKKNRKIKIGSKIPEDFIKGYKTKNRFKTYHDEFGNNYRIRIGNKVPENMIEGFKSTGYKYGVYHDINGKIYHIRLGDKVPEGYIKGKGKFGRSIK